MGYDFACFILSVCYSIPMTDKKTKLIMVTDHQVRNLFDIVDRAYVLGEQSVIANGTPSEILKSSKAIELYFGSYNK